MTIDHYSGDFYLKRQCYILMTDYMTELGTAAYDNEL